MNDQDLLYWIDFTLVKGIGNITARQIIETLGDISFLFKEKNSYLEQIPRISKKIIDEIHRPEILHQAEKEVLFIKNNKITPLYINNTDCPDRLKDRTDAPILLYLRGNNCLNIKKLLVL